MNIHELKFFIREIFALKKHHAIIHDKKHKEEFEQFRIIKSMHSIEKGLSLKAPRTGFGKAKVEELLKRIEEYYNAGFDVSHCSVQMALNATAEYLRWNREKGAPLTGLEEKFAAVGAKIPQVITSGGAVEYEKGTLLDFDATEFEKVVNSRHSVRCFGEEKVDVEKVKEAIFAANRCPSACNRQMTRVHIVSSDDGKRFLSERSQGVGGFAEDCDMFLLITSNISAFDFMENNQWIVSAGIFMGYLTLELHARKIASCVVQRNLIRTQKINEIRDYFKLPNNEEIICSMGIGSYPDKFKVPQSVRLPLEELIQEH